MNRVIQLRKQYDSALLKAIKKICELDNTTHHDFGEYIVSPIIMNLLMILISNLVSWLQILVVNVITKI